MAQLVKCLLCKHEDLSLISNTHIKSWVVAEFIILLLERWRQKDPWSLLTRQPSLKGTLGPNERPCLKENKTNKK